MTSYPRLRRLLEDLTRRIGPEGPRIWKVGKKQANGTTATPIYKLGILFVGQIMSVQLHVTLLSPCSRVMNSFALVSVLSLPLRENAEVMGGWVCLNLARKLRTCGPFRRDRQDRDRQRSSKVHWRSSFAGPCNRLGAVLGKAHFLPAARLLGHDLVILCSSGCLSDTKYRMRARCRDLIQYKG